MEGKRVVLDFLFEIAGPDMYYISGLSPIKAFGDMFLRSYIWRCLLKKIQLT